MTAAAQNTLAVNALGFVVVLVLLAFVALGVAVLVGRWRFPEPSSTRRPILPWAPKRATGIRTRLDRPSIIDRVSRYIHDTGAFDSESSVVSITNGNIGSSTFTLDVAFRDRPYRIRGRIVEADESKIVVLHFERLPQAWSTLAGLGAGGVFSSILVALARNAHDSSTFEKYLRANDMLGIVSSVALGILLPLLGLIPSDLMNAATVALSSVIDGEVV